MKQKVIYLILSLVIVTASAILYFFVNKNIQHIEQVQKEIIASRVNTTQNNRPTKTVEKKTNQFVPTQDWTKVYEKHKFTFETPAGWKLTNIQDVKNGSISQIETVSTSQFKASGFAIQSPEDENRIITVSNAEIRFGFVDLHPEEPSYAHTAGINEDLTCHNTLQSYGITGPAYATVAGKKIEICPFEFPEALSHGFSLNVYIPITESQGLHISGSTSDTITTEEFLPTFIQILSTFKWVE